MNNCRSHILNLQCGPFKARDPYGNPLVDMFSPQGFAEEDTNKAGNAKVINRKFSPRIGILGHNTFTSEPGGTFAKRKLETQASNTVNKTIKSIEEQMVLGYELLASFKQEAETARGEIDVLMQELIEKVENVQDDCQPEIYKDYKGLKKNMAD